MEWKILLIITKKKERKKNGQKVLFASLLFGISIILTCLRAYNFKKKEK
jgi:hypothetical protein